MIALASGLNTYKMHNGHRGINHPVKNVETGLGEITSQNHGFVVKMEDVEASDNVALTHVHLNDQTVAGIKKERMQIVSPFNITLRLLRAHTIADIFSIRLSRTSKTTKTKHTN